VVHESRLERLDGLDPAVLEGVRVLTVGDEPYASLAAPAASSGCPSWTPANPLRQMLVHAVALLLFAATGTGLLLVSFGDRRPGRVAHLATAVGAFGVVRPPVGVNAAHRLALRPVVLLLAGRT
jgi:hypothetical protein